MSQVAAPSQESEPGLSSTSIAAQLEHLLASRALKPSERLCAFLRFVVEKSIAGEAAEIKEYVIGTAVYGRPASFDPKADSIVRVEASRLRTKLREYYSDEGREDPLVIGLPKGSYAPAFSLREAPVPTPSRAPELEGQAHHGQGSVPLRRGVIAVAAAVVLVAAGYVAYRVQSHPEAVLDLSEFSAIAVMPLLSLTPASGSDAIAGGLAEDIAHLLAQGRDLRVVSPGSVARLGVSQGLAAVRGEFKVGSVLEGSVRQEPGRVRVSIQLASVMDGYHLWSGVYDRVPGGLALQSELSGIVSAEVAATLARLSADAAGGARNEIEALNVFRQGTALLDWSYDHMLTSENLVGRPTQADITGAIRFFERAVALNPRYARAWAALAHSYSASEDGDPARPAKMRAAAERALKLQPGIASAYAMLGYSKFLNDWDFAGAETDFKRALELQPRLLGVYRLYGDCASLLGHQAEALAELERGALVYRDSPMIGMAKGVILFHARRYPEMALHAREMLARHRDYVPAHWLLGLALEQQGQHQAAADEFRRCLRLADRDPRATVALGHVNALMGRRGEVLTLIEDYRQNPGARWNVPYLIALLYTGLGETDYAIEWLDRAYQRHDNGLPYMKLDPRFDPLRTDPRFVALLKKLRLA